MVDAPNECRKGMKLISGGPFLSEVLPFCIDEHEYTQEENAAYETLHPTGYFELVVTSRNGDIFLHPKVMTDKEALEKIAIGLRKNQNIVDAATRNATTPDHQKIVGQLAGPRKPMVYVDFNEAWDRCKARGGYLASGSQWEKAARGPTGKEYATKSGELKKEEARVDAKKEGPADVMSYPPNDYGVYDMTGNALEWVSDGTIVDGVIYKGIRGGSWGMNNDGQILRASFHGLRYPRDARGNALGFRCAADVLPATSNKK